ncbi:hypothetical protein LguiA_010706 [Lonicera macranthoides]
MHLKLSISSISIFKIPLKAKAIPKTTNTPFHTGITSNILINLCFISENPNHTQSWLENLKRKNIIC